MDELVIKLNLQAEECLKSDAAQSFELACQALEIAKNSGNFQQEAQASLTLGSYFKLRGGYAAALDAFNQALKLFGDTGDFFGQARTLDTLGRTYSDIGDYCQALIYFEESLDLFRTIGKLGSQATVINNIAGVEIRLGNLETALELLNSCLRLRREDGDTKGVAADLNSAAFVHVQKAFGFRDHGDQERCIAEAREALNLLQQAVVLARLDANNRLEAYCHQTMAEAYHAMGNNDTAIQYSKNNQTRAKTLGDLTLEAHATALIGRCLQHSGQLQPAIEKLQKALGAFDEIERYDESARICCLLADAYEKQGDAINALAYLRRWLNIEQAIHTEDAERHARALSAQRQFEQINQEIERYRSMALEDALTGLANRRQIDTQLTDMLEQATQTETLFSVALADIDHFKSINDRFSHAMGDTVLKHISQILRKQCRGEDIAGRYGGEEFILLFRDLDLARAAEICERIRDAIARYDWEAICPGLQVTLSIGVAATTFGQHGTDLLANVDHLLYEAKRAGRNCVKSFMSEV